MTEFEDAVFSTIFEYNEASTHGQQQSAIQKLAQRLAAAEQLAEAMAAIGRIASSDGVSQEDWDKYLAPFARKNSVSFTYILDAIRDIAKNVLFVWQNARQSKEHNK